MTGELPLRVEGDRNVAQATFEIALEKGEVFTVTLESLDFDARISIQDPAGGAAVEDRNSGAYTNAWLVHETTGPAKLLVQVGAEDARSGAFTLEILPGRVDPPARPLAWTQATLEHCEAAAARARSQGDLARSISNLKVAWQCATRLGEYGRAKSIAERHLSDAEAAGVPFEITRGRAHLGATEKRLGNASRAQELLESARTAAETARAAAGSVEEARGSAALLCLVYVNLGDLAAARLADDEALAHYRTFVERASVAGNRDLEIQSWQKLSGALVRVGEISQASEAIGKALALAESSQDPAVLSSLLLAHGKLLAAEGRPAEARRQCERALAGSPLASTRIEILGTLASACIDLGRFEHAVHAMDELEALCRERGETRYEVPTRINRAAIALQLGDPAGARAILESTLLLPDAGSSPTQQVRLLCDLGAALKACGDSDAARTRYAEALEICERTGDRAEEVAVLLNLGGLHQDLREFEVAGAAYDRAAEVARKAEERVYAAAAQGAKGYLLYLTGNLDGALSLARAAAEELERLGDGERAVDAHDTLARIGLARGDLGVVEDALCAAEGLFEEQDVQRLPRFSAARWRSRFADWGAIAQDLAAARVLASAPDSPERQRALVTGFQQAGRWKGRVLLEGMRRPRREPGHGDSGNSTEAMATRDTEAVIEYAAGLENLHAYVLQGGSLRCVDLGAYGGIEERARDLVDAVSGSGATPDFQVDAAAWLYERLLSPVLALLPQTVTDLTIIPTPGLSGLPFECLVAPPAAPDASRKDLAGLRYLIDDYCVTYAPSSPVLAELRRCPGSRRAPRCMILGDPVYGTESPGVGTPEKLALARPGNSFLEYARLKKTREEALEIARLLLLRDPGATDEQRARLLEIPGPRTGSMLSGRFDMRLGADARADALRGDLSVYTELHIAAHGYVDPTDPRRTGLVLSYEPVSEGLFPLEDVLGLRLDAELVVLSACDTARGPIVRGEGVESLAYAFLEAGAHSVVASLWKLEDAEAADIMKHFYSLRLGENPQLGEGMSPAQALRLAKLEFRRSRAARGVSKAGAGSARILAEANPYFWAPFVFVGAP